MKKRIVLNVTTSADWRRRPVGIVRVEREIIKAVRARFDSSVVPVYFDRYESRFKSIKSKFFADIVSDAWVLSDDPDNDAGNVRGQLCRFNAQDNDTFVTVGSDWSFRVPDAVEKLYGPKRVMVSALYDLIPLIYPEFTPTREFYDQFDYHYRKLAIQAKSIFAISETSAETLREFWRERQLIDVPQINVIPLASFVRTDADEPLTESDKKDLASMHNGEPYILYVSTIEPRKNHQILIDIWRDLHAERGPNCPKLIMVGMKGWGSDDLVRSATRMNAFAAGKIIFKEGLSDRLLKELYRRCFFSVFPSYFEGWGLAATEAASFGKVCVVANNSALNEATNGVMPSYHPLDFPGWKVEIDRLLDDRSYRETLETKIASQNFSRNWRDFGRDFCETML
ncbi:glycosyltransferase family 4 protein [Aurantiacibacter suaedae]|uniref:glycosyltransferase family 4 protein n=1 Tax=Aurantiacibacter suaedae TaxID=2545755 RepID=UPI0010F4E24B|nr:glycosyltransferase family 1 protein [Aurantiacibacter suaedae]